MSASALVLSHVTKRYGTLAAVEDVSLTVHAGTCHGLIGPNGAGKSTLLGLIAGTVRASEGTVELFGQDVSRCPEYERARHGLVKTFQHTTLFDDLTVHDNIALAVQQRLGFGADLWRRRRRRVLVSAQVDHLIARVGLDGRHSRKAGALSHGERRQLEVATVLGVAPRVLLLDEPTAGMSPAETLDFVALIESVLPKITVVITEHDLDVLFRLAQHVTVLSAGRVLISGTPEAVESSQDVQRAYVGRGRTGGTR